MFYKLLSICTVAVFISTNNLSAQTEKDARPEMEIGSNVLYQDGDDKYSYKNGIYSYEKVVDVPATNKAALYDRIKAWIVATLKTSKESMFFDDNEKNSITANTALRLKDNPLGITSQVVEFKLIISFKDDKVRIQASDFVYRGLYPGMLYQKSFNDLRPFGKKVMRTIYEDFDGQFVAMRKGITNAAKNTTSENW